MIERLAAIIYAKMVKDALPFEQASEGLREFCMEAAKACLEELLKSDLGDISDLSYLNDRDVAGFRSVVKMILAINDYR